MEHDVTIGAAEDEQDVIAISSEHYYIAVNVLNEEYSVINRDWGITETVEKSLPKALMFVQTAERILTESGYVDAMTQHRKAQEGTNVVHLAVDDTRKH